MLQRKQILTSREKRNGNPRFVSIASFSIVPQIPIGRSGGFRSKTRGRSPVFARLARTSVDNLRMNGAGDAVMEFGVELGKSVHVVDGSVGDVSHL